MKKSNERPDICGPCGGVCCKFVPGIALPTDFGNHPLEIWPNVRRSLLTKKWAIDYYESDDDFYPAYYIRPAIKNHNWPVDAAWGGDGECVFLTSKGCSFFYKDRPFQCRKLEPKKNGNCKLDFDKYDCQIEWKLYREIIDNFITDQSDH